MMGRWLSAFVGLGMLSFGTITFVLGLILGHGAGGSLAIAETPAEPPAAEVAATDTTGVAAEGAATGAAGSRTVTVPADGVAAGGASDRTEVATLPPPTAGEPAAGEPAAGEPAAGGEVAEPPAEPPAVTQVRSGPSPQRPPSSKLRGPLLQAAMAPPPVVPEPVPPMPAEIAGPPSVLSVQVARFLMKENADALAGELAGLGYQPQIVLAREPGVPSAPSWYMVTLGPQPDAETANRLAREATAALGLPAHAVSWPLATE